MNLTVADMHSNTKKKRKRGRTLSRMDDILLKEPGSMPKIKIELNDRGQPVGENYRKFKHGKCCQLDTLIGGLWMLTRRWHFRMT